MVNYKNSPKKVSRLYAESQGRPDARGRSVFSTPKVTKSRAAVRKRAEVNATGMQQWLIQADRKTLRNMAEQKGVRRTWLKTKGRLRREIAGGRSR